MITFDSRALQALERLESAGFQAYLVGGCVRDGLRDVVPHDYDITTSALPEETKAVFAGLPVIETGLKHGTVTVLWEGLPLEVTTYRVDGVYSDGRRPEQVSFTRSLTEDLARRDFTVNAMAWSPLRGLQDPFGGRQDLEQGILRCVGEAERRFTEDALRILRGLRFSATLGYGLEAETRRGMLTLKDRLSLISAERIREEWVKLLCGDFCEAVLLEYPEILGVFLPELTPCVGFDQRNFHHVHTLYAHLARAVASIPSKPHLRVAAFLHDIGKPPCFSLDEGGVGHFYGHAARSAEMADEILRRLKFDNETRKSVVTLIHHHDAPVEPTAPAVRRKMNKLGAEGFFDLLSLMRADNLALAPEFFGRQETYDRLQEVGEAILSEKQCFSLRDLAVDGRDLMALGYSGPAIGTHLAVLLNAVLDGSVPNEKEELLHYLSEQNPE